MFDFFKKNKKNPTSPYQKSKHHSSSSSGVKQSLLSLEQRLMFDAAASATAAEVATEQVAQEQAEAAVSSDTSHEGTGGEQGGGEDVVQALTNYMPAEKCVEVAFVDPTVPNYRELLAGMDPNIEVILLDGGQDGVEQMAEALSGRSGIDAIHLISHGSSGELQLGTGTLNAESMSSEYADEFTTIRSALSAQADLLVYGCSFGEGAEGADAVNLLAELTGADVAASSDATGHIDLGGDWEFEVQVGSIETDLALTDSAQMNWAGILGTETVKDTFSSTSYGNNNGTQSWSSSWTETDASGGGASGGDVRVNSGQLRIDTDGMGNAASRGVNLSGATSATLTFTYSNTLTGADRIEARISTDNGATYVTLAGGVFSNALNTGSGSASFDLSGYASANTRIQFIVTGTGGGDRLYVDNVQVSYDTSSNTAPTISNLSGDSLSYTEGAGAVVIDQGANALVSDSDSTNFDTGALTVSIPVGCEPTEDVVSIRNQGTGTGQIGVSGNTVTYGGVAIGTFAGGAGGNSLVITFNSNATPTAVTALVKNITYEDINTDSPAPGSFTIRFALTDGDGGTSANYDVSAYVSGVNDAPTDLTLSANTVAENAANGTVVGTLTATDPDTGDTKTYSLTDNAGGRFAINSSTGVLTVANGSLLNYEAATSHSITVRITDSGGLTYDETFTINLTDVNEAMPVISSNGGGATASITVSENTTAVTTVTATDADTRQTLIYSISGGADAAKFTINSSTGALSFVSAPNYETPTDNGGDNVYDVTVQVSDGKGGTATQTIAVTVTNVNEAPTTLTLSASTVAENAATGTVVGTAAGTDPDAGDTKTYSLTDTAGGRFAINANTGVLTVANGSLLNYEASASHTVTVRVTDSGGQSYTETFTINLTNVNEGPTGADATVTTNEDTPRTLTTANFGFSDVDAGDSLSAVRIDTVPSAGSLTLSGVAVTAGQVISAANITAGNLVFTPAADANGTGYASVTFSVRDSAGTYDAAPNTLTVHVTPINDAPILSTNEGGTVDEGGAIVLTGKHLQVADVDTPPNELRYTLTALPVNGALLLKGTPLGLKDSFTQEDINNGILEYVHGSKTTVPANDTKEAQLSGKDTAAQASIDSSSLEYAHDGSEAASDSFAFVVSDGAGGTLGESMFKIAVTHVNDAPVLSTNEGGTVDEGGAIVLTGKHLQVADVDTPPNELRYTLTALPANGALLLKGTPLGLNDPFTQEDINNGILEYAHDGGETTSDRVTFMVDDGAGGLVKESSFEITVNPMNDAPTDLALSANTVVENATTGTVVGTVTGTDVDAGDTKTYSLSDTAGGRFAINASTGQLTVADGSLLNYEAATSHTVTVRVTDSGGQSYDETFTINLTNVNEGPTGADATITITEDTQQALTAANFGFSDVDAGDSFSAVRIDTLPGSGTLTLSGVAVTAGQVVTVADINAGNVVFTPAVDANGTGYATLTFSVRDSNSAYDTAPNSLIFDVTAVNDGPTRTAGTVSNLTVSEDAGLASLGLGGVTYSPGGGADESGQALTYAVTAIPSASVGNVFLADGTTRVTVGSYTLADIQGMQFKPTANASGVTAFQFNVYDSGGTATGGANTISQFILIRVNAVNDAPTITNLSGDSLSYSEGAGPVVIEQSGNALVADVDSTNLDTGSLTVSIPSGGDSAEDVLSIRNQGTGAGQIGVSGSNITYGGVTIGTFTGGSNGSDLVITLNSSATPTRVTALVKNITYENTDTNAPTAGARTVRYVLTDGDGETSANYDTTVTVSGVNDAPTDLSLSASTVAENAATGTVVGTAAGTDPDAGDTKTYSLTDTAGGRFAINASTGALTVADGSLLNYESATSHSVTVRVTDAGGLTYDRTFTINLTNVNEAPTNLTLTGSTTYRPATAYWGIRDNTVSPNTSLSEIHLSNESAEDRFLLPDNPRKVIDIATEGPLPIDILKTGPSVASTPIEKVIATHETKRLTDLGQKRESDVVRDQGDIQITVAAEMDRKDFHEPDDPIENVEESTALKLSATMGLAAAVLQNSLGNTTKLSRSISRPASTSNVPPNTTPRKSPVDDHASTQSRSEYSRSTTEDADQAEP